MDISSLLVKGGAVSLLGLALWTAHLHSCAILNAIVLAAKEIPRKSQLITQAQWDFNILFAAILVMASGLLELVNGQTFVVLLVAVLGALGVKSVAELRGADREKN